MRAPEKLCIFCEHFRWKNPYSLYSTATGPIDFPGESACKKGNFDGLDSEPEDESAFRAIILRGQNCAEYEQVKS